jgi:hypothetical protein
MSEMPFSELTNEEFKKLFPKEGDDYKGHIFNNGHWYLYAECDDDGNFYDEYADEYDNWHNE